jgi:hypothetical protein
MAQSNVVAIDPSADYPLANTEATRMLAAGLEKANEDKGWSQRQIAKMLNYKTSVVLSHMALGRVPIPVDRALDFARLLKMDASRFLLAVLEQRHPDIDFLRILGASAKRKATGKGGRESFVLDELESLAGRQLDELPNDIVNVLREAVSNPNAPRRWLAPHEVPVIEAIRETHPQGLSPKERQRLTDFLAKL